jgi:murein DD-endopeptidase MepM/ murein hydrolase activator NlpD
MLKTDSSSKVFNLSRVGGLVQLRVLLMIIVVLMFSGCLGQLLWHQDRYIKYKVAKGDTLVDLSRRFAVTEAEIEAMNPALQGDLVAGGVIVIPCSSETDVCERWIEAMSPNKYSELSAAVREYLGKLLLPVRGVRSSRFGWRKGRFHEGLDIAAASGTKIRAAHAGEVCYEGHGMRGYGNVIALCNGTIMTVYAHNRRNRVSAGQQVRVGQVIAEVGSTGRSTNPHLHFEVRVRNRDGKYMAVDPEAFIEP